MRPAKQQINELILPVFTQWEKVGSVTGILADLEQGQFYTGSLLVEQMMRDDRVRAVLNTLIMSVLGREKHWEAEGDTGKAQKIADEIDEQWDDMVPEEELYELVRWALMLGAGVMRTPWDMKQGTAKCQTWHPGALWFNLVDNEYYLRHQAGQVVVPQDSLDWVLLTPYSHKYGRLNGLVRATAMVWLARQWVFRDRARHSEVHGMPIRVGIVPSDADKRAKDNYRRGLQAIGTETTIIAPQGGEGKKYGVELIEAKSNSHDVFSAQLDHLDDCLAILVLGQKMSSKGAQGLGSDANPGDSVRHDLMKWLARIIERFAYRLARRWVELNHGPADAEAYTPHLCIEVDPPEDGQKKAQELSLLGDVVSKLQSHGLDIRELLEHAGVPLLSEAEAQKQADDVAQRAADAMQPVDDKKPPEPPAKD